MIHCYIDESIHDSCGFVATSFVFAGESFEKTVEEVLRDAGLSPPSQEFKSSARMDLDSNMQLARNGLLALSGSKAKVAVFFGPFNRATLGKHTLQALQSVVVRNGINPAALSVYCDEEIFPSEKEALRLHGLFNFLSQCRIYPRENSRKRLGIQVADAVAHSFGRILKEELTGKQKLVDIGGPGTGYEEGTLAPLGWELLMTLRYGLMTRPMVKGGEPYDAARDPVVLDPENDDPVGYGQHPVLLGWGVQTAPEADDSLRQGVERAFGRIWLGCIH
jgi:hypothetical protein